MPTPMRRSGDHGVSSGDSGQAPPIEHAEAEERSRMARLGAYAAGKAGEAASYVRERGVRGLTDDLVAVASKHPLAAIGLSLGIGYSIGRMTSRK